MNSTLAAIIKFAVLNLAIISIVGLVVVFLVIPWSVRSKDVEVPDLVGESYDRAVALLYDAGLLVADDVEAKASSDIPKGFVLEQSLRRLQSQAKEAGTNYVEYRRSDGGSARHDG